MKDGMIQKLPLEEQQAIFQAEMEYYGEKILIDTSGKILFVNRKYAKEFNKVPENMIGRNIDDFFEDKIKPIILNTEDFGTEYIEAKDEVIPYSCRKAVFCASPIVDEHGRCLGHMWYDGRHWLSRYKSLYGKLQELFAELERKLLENRSQNKIIGKSVSVIKLKKNIAEASTINSTVLIEGETGTGKELVADAIVAESKRKNKPFVKINCAAIPKELLESELFGYEAGAFTGALKSGKKGKFVMADGGTIMLDEVNSLDLSAQAKILRVIQEKVVDPVGGESSIPVDVRIIAVSNRSLADMVSEGTFREDLYYRLNVIHINVPALRERKDDIPELVKYFVREFNVGMNRHVEYIDSSVYKLLQEYNWPGNIRELQNYIERAMITAWKDILRPSNFFWMGDMASDGTDKVAENNTKKESTQKTLSQILKEVEKDIITKTIEECGGNKTIAAKKLGIARQVLYRKINSFDIG